MFFGWCWAPGCCSAGAVLTAVQDATPKSVSDMCLTLRHQCACFFKAAPTSDAPNWQKCVWCVQCWPWFLPWQPDASTGSGQTVAAVNLLLLQNRQPASAEEEQWPSRRLEAGVAADTALVARRLLRQDAFHKNDSRICRGIQSRIH